MKCAVLTMAAMLASGGALAQARPSTVTRLCAESQRDVQSNGAIVLGTGGHTFDRFVRNRSFCQFDEFLDPAWVPSRDRPACFVGYRCKVGPVWD